MTPRSGPPSSKPLSRKGPLSATMARSGGDARGGGGEGAAERPARKGKRHGCQPVGRRPTSTGSYEADTNPAIVVRFVTRSPTNRRSA